MNLMNCAYDDDFLSMYNFLWDRMRAIRMDLRMQHIFNQDTIQLHEQMVCMFPLSHIPRWYSTVFFFEFSFSGKQTWDSWKVYAILKNWNSWQYKVNLKFSLGVPRATIAWNLNFILLYLCCVTHWCRFYLQLFLTVRFDFTLWPCTSFVKLQRERVSLKSLMHISI